MNKRGIEFPVEIGLNPIKSVADTYLLSPVIDISKRKALEAERGKLILELLVALENIKVLHGFIPISASCKNIRYDHGFWDQIETYISNSEATFNHSICPDCHEILYPDL